jgi:hypothetical protein
LLLDQPDDWCITLGELILGLRASGPGETECGRGDQHERDRRSGDARQAVKHAQELSLESKPDANRRRAP